MGTFKIAKTVLKSMFNKPATLMYPVVEREWQERTRGSIGIDVDACILCGICSKKCPTSAIEVDRKGRTWEIQRMQCIQCGACVEACPKDCLIMDPKYTTPDGEKIIDTFDIPEQKKAEKKDADTAKAEKNDKGSDTGTEDAGADGDGSLCCNLGECVYCGLCARECPCDALTVDRKEKIWKVDEDACVKCGACIDKCPKKCLSFGDAGGEAAADEAADDKKDAAKADEKKPAKKARKKKLPVLESEKCIYCRMCENICPREALSVEVEEWILDPEKCIGCGICAKDCPAEAIEMKEED